VFNNPGDCCNFNIPLLKHSNFTTNFQIEKCILNRTVVEECKVLYSPVVFGPVSWGLGIKHHQL